MIGFFLRDLKTKETLVELSSTTIFRRFEHRNFSLVFIYFHFFNIITIIVIIIYKIEKLEKSLVGLSLARDLNRANPPICIHDLWGMLLTLYHSGEHCSFSFARNLRPPPHILRRYSAPPFSRGFFDPST